MGKKSSSSAPAVPKEVGIAMEKQAAVAEKQQAFWEDTMFPWMKDSTEQQNALQEKLVDQYLSDYDWYRNYTTEQTNKTNAIRDEFYRHWKEDYSPIEAGLIDKAQTFNSDAYAEQQAQAAIGDVSAQYANQRQQQALNMSKYGIDPSSGQFMGQMNALGINQAAATAAASNNARQAAIQLGWDKSLQLANLEFNTPALQTMRLRGLTRLWEQAPVQLTMLLAVPLGPLLSSFRIYQVLIKPD